MKLVKIKLDQLKQNINNPRNNDNSVKALTHSIKEFGYRNPIIINQDNIIVAGHARYKALKRLNKSVVWVIKQDFTDDEMKAYTIADNRINELSSWDYKLLEDQLQELEINNFEMKNIGFEDWKLELDIQTEEEEEVEQEWVDGTEEDDEEDIEQDYVDERMAEQVPVIVLPINNSECPKCKEKHSNGTRWRVDEVNYNVFRTCYCPGCDTAYYETYELKNITRNIKIKENKKIENN